MRRRPPTTPPVYRPRLPFDLDGVEVVGYAFVSGDRWMTVTTDELQHELYETLRANRAPESDPIPRALGPALVRLVN